MNLIYTLLAVDKTAPLPNFSEKVIYGGEILLIGFLTVFAVLALLLIILSLFKNVFGILGTQSTSTTIQEASAVATPVSNFSEDEEIVAVIAAAIAMAESESNGLKFKVVSFRRK